MTTEELDLIINALDLYSKVKMSDELYWKVKDLREKLIKQLTKKLHNWYLVITWNWSWYSWQTNCYKWVRWSKAIKMTRKEAEKYVWDYRQSFSDWTHNDWRVWFELDKPKTTWSLWDYEWWLREKWLPV